MTKRVVTACLSVLLLLPASARAGLKIGDLAPPLTVAEWVKGDPVDMDKVRGNKIVIVEFWATWCGPCIISIPHLTELQKKYKDHVAVVGATNHDPLRGNTLSAVKDFVSRQGDKMQYSVAFDKTDATVNAYLLAAGVDGIPYAFVVGKDGRLTWHGSPLDPELDDVLTRMIAGTYDTNVAKVQAEVKQKMAALQQLAAFGQWDKVKAGLEDVLKLDPANRMALEAMYRAVYVEQFNDRAGLKAWLTAHLAAHREDPNILAEIAALICDDPDLTTRDPALALEAAQAAYDSGAGDRAKITQVYARACYLVGRLDRAVALQEEAVGLITAEDDKAMAQQVLEYYRSCQQLQAAP